ncbi:MULTISPECIES: bifunctional UDP-sugar hydrolase/5'-nucleotidase [Kosmotoga]|uniref:5'-Nucleotidase domain protein n=1 Tax=Kosmotoga olearia (strain ATCC BAA-1733 / DSM 21960 / TBF 19.5.1) TaxID=521045 RepID=C5CGM9_KOSOT|nr:MULTISPECIES: bifunctional UDP-sugar hydrolase/5'-nucleotidase [Kosmotoga]ACR79611.1 5'-Nucleotidase domain protein [Kosmotoga olearia TBF 19.5.1]MDI3523861.1 5-nucleotidase / UDP-sugar diphosphatase [Kosmotoga sp.]MDK2953121.1 5-nucleotidase / UDP-sugar diphosphatase [Kosmotoga sp.]OAA22158.1 metallophosphatase [Kosmotoga sp. DU53]
MRKLLLVSLLVLIAVFVLAEKITILHINDTHGHAWTFSEWKNPDIGGFALIATLVDQFRKENPNTLFLHAGDLNTGVPESDLIDAAADIVALNLMGLDAIVLGNHEFDNPPEVLAKQIKWAHFPFLSANIYKDGKPAFTPYIIKEVGGLKVAIVGFTTEETEILEALYAQGYEWKSVIEVAKELVPELKKQADLVIALTHLGTGKPIVGVNSIELAEQVDGIDVIVDGHSHSLLTEPMVVNETLIIQAGEWGKYLGKLDLEVENGGIVFVSYESIPIKKANIESNRAVDIVLDYFKKLGDEKLDTVVGETKILLEGTRAIIRNQDTNLGHLVADAMVWKTGADLAITNAGGIRASIQPGPITYRDILKVLPFGNTLYIIKITGEQLMEVLKYTTTIPAGKGARPQVANLSYKIENGEVKDVMIKGEPIDLSKTYTLVTNNYMAAGGDGYKMLKGLEGYDTGFVLADVVMEYISEISPITEYDDAPRVIKVEAE